MTKFPSTAEFCLYKSTRVINALRAFACFHSYVGLDNSPSFDKVDSVAEAYFCTRAVDKEDDQNYDSSSCFDESSNNETDEESQNGVEFEFEFGLSDVDRSE